MRFPFAAAVPIAQVAPTDLNFATLLSGGGQGAPLYEVVRIVIVNTDVSARTFRLCLDRDAGGSPSYDKTNALYWDASLNANTTLNIESQHPGSGISLGRDGALGFRSGTADAFTCTVFAVSAKVRDDEDIPFMRMVNG